MKKQFLLAFLICFMAMGFVSCSDDDGVSNSTISVIIKPAGMESSKISNAVITLKNLTTSEEEVIEKKGEITNGSFDLDVIDGTYNFKFEADIEYSQDGKSVNAKVRANKENVEIVGGTIELDLKDLLYIYQPEKPSGLIIAEIFFTGTKTPEDKQYGGDKYFKIYNNSSEVIYADGMAIAETKLQTIGGYNDYKEVNLGIDDRNTKTPIQALYRIPGNGTEHPINPGEYMLIVDNGINHTKANSNSFDLSKADFEWYDESTNPNFLDVDSEVPNLDKIYCYTATIWSPHNRGFHSYLLVNMGIEANAPREDFLKNNVYKFSYTYEWASGSKEMTQSCYFVNNKDIVDAVNLSITSKFVRINIDSSLDQGWTYCGKVDMDESRYGKCVRRKILGGKTLKDTNDSSADFLAEQTADPTYLFK